MNDMEVADAAARSEIKRTLRCLVSCIGLVGLALFAQLLLSPAKAAVKPVSPDTKAERPTTFRHIPKGCSSTKPREVIRLRMFKMDKDGNLVAVGVVLIPKGC